MYSSAEIRAGLRDTFGDVLLMQPGRFESMVAALSLGKPQSNAVRLRGMKLAASRASGGQRRTEVLSLFGPISHKNSWVLQFFGGTATSTFKRQFDKAMADDSVGSLTIVVDSPGGGVYGVQELSQHIYEACGRKPITSYADPLAASAAYWIPTAADKLYMTPSGDVGSIGVYMLHEDWSGMLNKAGVKPSYIVSQGSPHKTEGNFDEPLSASARAHLQTEVDATYEKFVADVARNRGVRPATVKAKFGEGRVLPADKALKAGMVDGIATFDELMSGKVKGGGLSVEARRDRIQSRRDDTDKRRAECAANLPKPDKSNTRWRAAYHEAGHVVIGASLGIAIDRAEVSDGDGFFYWHKSNAHRDDFCRMHLAGGIAEARFAGGDSFDLVSGEDDQNIRALYPGLCGALRDNTGIGQVADQTGFIVGANWKWIERAAAALFRDGRITGEQVKLKQQGRS